jgi:serine-type D-Ala-D-Ala carboxypeptidase/endopeptidase
VQALLPATFRVPRFAGRAITIGDLILHRSGLPAITVPDGPRDGFAERVRSAIGRVTLQREIGSVYEFSPLGLDLLDVALQNYLGMPVDAAIRQRVLQPLGIRDVAPAWAITDLRRRAVGHDIRGRPLPPRRGPHWLGSILGVSRFAVAASDTVRGPLARAFALMLRTRSLGPDPALSLALGWRVIQLEGRDVYWFNANDAPGYSAFVAADPGARAAAAVLANSARPVDAVAGRLVQGRVPTVPPPGSRP